MIKLHQPRRAKAQNRMSCMVQNLKTSHSFVIPFELVSS